MRLKMSDQVSSLDDPHAEPARQPCKRFSVRLSLRREMRQKIEADMALEGFRHCQTLGLGGGSAVRSRKRNAVAPAASAASFSRTAQSCISCV